MADHSRGVLDALRSSKYASAQFWVDTIDRTIASGAQGFLVASGLDGAGVLDVDWAQTWSITGAMALVSLATSIAFRGKNRRGTDASGAPPLGE